MAKKNDSQMIDLDSMVAKKIMEGAKRYVKDRAKDIEIDGNHSVQYIIGDGFGRYHSERVSPDAYMQWSYRFMDASFRRSRKDTERVKRKLERQLKTDLHIIKVTCERI